MIIEETFQYPIHPLAKGIMQMTEQHAVYDPFFSRMEKDVLSLLIYYMEDLFCSPFPNEVRAFDALYQNPRIFQYSLDVFQKAFSEMPETSRAKQVFKHTPFVKLTPNWESHDRRVFMHTFIGLRKRFQITDEAIREDIAQTEALNPGVSGQFETGFLDKPSEKKWVCPECEVSSTSEQWNQETIAKYGEDVFPIEEQPMNESIFICPHCKCDNCGEVILEEFQSV